VDTDARVARRVRVLVFCLLVPLIAVAGVLMVKLWPRGGDVVIDSMLTNQVRAEVVAVKACPEPSQQCDVATVRLADGRSASIEIPKGPLAPKVTVGDRVMLGVTSQPGQPVKYDFVDQDRSRPLLVLALVFAVAVVALSRWRGIAALVALAITAVMLTQFVMPAILKGSDPLLVAVVGGTAIMVLALYLTHGVNARTSIALVGTIAALALTAVLGKAFVEAGKFTGLGIDNASVLGTYVEKIDLPGLLIAGLVIGALGVLDDVTVTQVSAVWELSAADPSAGRWSLLSAGLRIGRAHVASVVNTLVLAYAGAALPLLMIFAIQGVPGTYAVSTEQVAFEVIRGLVGSLGIIAAVPFTTALAAVAVADR
jgi:uncharacterized membrane protein